MRTLTVMQQPIQGCPEYDYIVVRRIPEPMDIASWARHTQELILGNLAVTEDYAVEHIAMCSTPPTKAGTKPSWELQQAINRLYKTYGTTYIIIKGEQQ